MNRGPGDAAPPSLNHIALHLSKEAGSLAEIVEKMQHAAEREHGEKLLRFWFLERAGYLRRIERLVAAHFHGHCIACECSWPDPEPGASCPFCKSSQWGVRYGRVTKEGVPVARGDGHGEPIGKLELLLWRQHGDGCACETCGHVSRALELGRRVRVE